MIEFSKSFKLNLIFENLENPRIFFLCAKFLFVFVLQYTQREHSKFSDTVYLFCVYEYHNRGTILKNWSGSTPTEIHFLKYGTNAFSTLRIGSSSTLNFTSMYYVNHHLRNDHKYLVVYRKEINWCLKVPIVDIEVKRSGLWLSYTQVTGLSLHCVYM